jgi:threonine aldolase
MKRWIDLRSDTVTEPTAEMRIAMANAEVGDDVFSDDPTINELERIAAFMLGKEAAVFVPSGTMSNQLALFTHCQKGDEVILDQNAHIVQHESGASAVIASVQLYTMKGKNGVWDLSELERAIKVRTVSTTRTRLICLENPLGGAVVPLAFFDGVRKVADRYHLPIHLDGARIFNAATALGVDVKAIAKYADSVSVCLSKGLAAPVGTVLVGSKSFIDEARWKRKLMGGGMRQVGILGAAGILALTKMTKRLAEDHQTARYLEKRLEEIPGITIDKTQRDINMVFFDMDHPKKTELEFHLKDRGVRILPYEQGFRFVTHYQIDQADIDHVVGIIKEYMSHA